MRRAENVDTRVGTGVSIVCVRLSSPRPPETPRPPSFSHTPRRPLENVDGSSDVRMMQAARQESQQPQQLQSPLLAQPPSQPPTVAVQAAPVLAPTRSPLQQLMAINRFQEFEAASQK